MTQFGPRASFFSTKWSSVYSCPGAAVTKYHKLGGLKQQEFIFSQFKRPEVQDPGVVRSVLSL